MLYRFRDMVSYLSKVSIFPSPRVFGIRVGVIIRISPRPLASENASYRAALFACRRLAILTQHRTVTDRDGQLQGHSIYRPSIASCGKSRRARLTQLHLENDR